MYSMYPRDQVSKVPPFKEKPEKYLNFSGHMVHYSNRAHVNLGGIGRFVQL